MKHVNSPTPEKIKERRLEAGLTQTEAAKLLYTHLSAIQKWEGGHRNMHPAFWELFLLKTVPLIDKNG